MKDIYDYYQQKFSIGQRFKKFRELLGKSIKQIEQEANNPLIKVTRIYMFEQGAIIPDIIFIQYFTETYRLNLNWLVTGTGKTFLKKDDCKKMQLPVNVKDENM
jgi:transcriptional regulator with XRE-family HTH domain